MREFESHRSLQFFLGVKMSTKTFSVDKILTAIEKNGYPQGYGHMLEDDRRQLNAEAATIVNACALGQAGLNLGVSVVGLGNALLELKVGAKEDIGTYVMGLNDYRKLSLKEIAANVRKAYKTHLHKTVTVETRSYNYTNWQGITVEV